MMTESTNAVPLWLRAWAWLTVATALLLVVLGAEVTTRQAGMADPVGLRNPLYLFEREADVSGNPLRFVHLWETGQRHLLIEHSHRLFGWIVGAQCLVFAFGCGISAQGAYRYLGLVAGVAVALQGLLGIMRVALNLQAGPELRTLHGCSAQLVFATLVVVAVFTTHAWQTPSNGISSSLRGAALGIAALVFSQMVAGAVLRHLLDPIAQRLHILLAFVAVASLLWLAWQAREADRTSAVWMLTVGITILVCLQPILGVEAWIHRFFARNADGAMILPDELHSSVFGNLVRSGHQVVGTLIFSSTVALVALLYRPRSSSSSPAALHVRAMEGVV